jgi:hypothetical protein
MRLRWSLLLFVVVILLAAFDFHRSERRCEAEREQEDLLGGDFIF